MMQALLSTSKRSCFFGPRACLWKRTISLKADGYPQDFIFLPNFLSTQEQRTLLSVALNKLDRNETLQYRRRRKEYLASSHSAQSDDVHSLFFPDEYYHFEKASHKDSVYEGSLGYTHHCQPQGHFDGVIKNYREMHVSAWPDEPGLNKILERLHSVHPQQPTQTHILHLASDGEIFVSRQLHF